jgi:outer membrane lipoprotein SlyB
MKTLSVVFQIALLVFTPLVIYAHVAELPPRPDTKMSLQLLSPISTSTSKKGDKFSCKVLAPIEYSGTIVEGHIRDLKRSGKVDKESKIDLAFDSITAADGQSAKFSAIVMEVFEVKHASEQGVADDEGTVRAKSSTIKTSVKRAAVGAGIGAVVGGLIAGPKGAIAGAVIGASVGVTTTLAQRGPDLEFKTGTQFTVVTSGKAHQ